MSTSEICHIAILVAEFYLNFVDNINIRPGFEDDDEDEQLVMPYLALYRRPNNRIDLDTLPPRAARRLFRFTIRQVDQIAELLFLPEIIRTDQRDMVGRREALAIVLGRLAYPGRLYTLSLLFGRSESALSRIIFEVIVFIATRWSKVLEFDHVRMTPQVLQQFSQSVHNAGSPLDCCFGFIDGTMRPVCRPTIGQRAIYNGHYRTHGFKYQSLLTPDGIIADLRGPFPGNTHDLTMLRGSRLYDVLEQHAWTVDRQPLAIYGDPAYTLTNHLLVPFRNVPGMPQLQREFNMRMAEHRVAV